MVFHQLAPSVFASSTVANDPSTTMSTSLVQLSGVFAKRSADFWNHSFFKKCRLTSGSTIRCVSSTSSWQLRYHPSNLGLAADFGSWSQILGSLCLGVGQIFVSRFYRHQLMASSWFRRIVDIRDIGPMLSPW